MDWVNPFSKEPSLRSCDAPDLMDHEYELTKHERLGAGDGQAIATGPAGLSPRIDFSRQLRNMA
jgi:hypothetical protein